MLDPLSGHLQLGASPLCPLCRHLISLHSELHKPRRLLSIFFCLFFGPFFLRSVPYKFHRPVTEKEAHGAHVVTLYPPVLARLLESQLQHSLVGGENWTIVCHPSVTNIRISQY